MPDLSYLYQMRCWVESTHVADLLLTGCAGIIIGGLSRAHVYLRFAEGAQNPYFRHFLWLGYLFCFRLLCSWDSSRLTLRSRSSAWGLSASFFAGITEDNFWRHFARRLLTWWSGLWLDRHECACLGQEGSSKSKKLPGEALLGLFLSPPSTGGRDRSLSWGVSYNLSLING